MMNHLRRVRIIFIFHISWTDSPPSLCSRLMKVTCCNLWLWSGVWRRRTHHDERAEQHGLDPLGTLMPEWSNGTSDILSEPTGHVSLMCVQNFYSTNISDLISRTGSSARWTAAVIVNSLFVKVLPCWTEQTWLQGENRLSDELIVTSVL